MAFFDRLSTLEFYLLLGGALLIYYTCYWLLVVRRRKRNRDSILPDSENPNLIKKVNIFGNSKNINTFEITESTSPEMEHSGETTEDGLDGMVGEAPLVPLQGVDDYSHSTFDYKQHLVQNEPLSSEADNLNNTDDENKIIPLRPTPREGSEDTS